MAWRCFTIPARLPSSLGEERLLYSLTAVSRPKPARDPLTLYSVLCVGEPGGYRHAGVDSGTRSVSCRFQLAASWEVSKRDCEDEESCVRWRIAVLVSAAIAISYLDRQTLPVAMHAIGNDIPLSNEQFSDAAVGISAFVRVYVRRRREAGRRIGNAARVHADHVVLVSGLRQPCAGGQLWHAGGQPVVAGRMGEGGGFPAATRVVAEWFPTKERATAMGIINAGTAVGRWLPLR